MENSSTETLGLGLSMMKAKGAIGVTRASSKKAESSINLDIGLKSGDGLQARGYTVMMTRTSPNVDISNQ